MGSSSSTETTKLSSPFPTSAASDASYHCTRRTCKASANQHPESSTLTARQDERGESDRCAFRFADICSYFDLGQEWYHIDASVHMLAPKGA